MGLSMRHVGIHYFFGKKVVTEISNYSNYR